MASLLAPWIYPLPLGLLLVLVGTVLLWQDHRAGGALLVGVATVFLYLLSTPLIADALTSRLEYRFGPVPVAEQPAVDAIVVLGGGVDPPARPRKAADLNDQADRIWHGAELYRAGRAPLVITTGTRPYEDAGQSAAAAAADLLVRLGVPVSSIIAPGKATSTRGDALAVRAETAARGIRRILLVTSALHMPRALATFRRAGIEVWPAATDHETVAPARRKVWPWLPNYSAFHRSNRAWHEYIGMLYYRMRGWA